MNKSWRKTILRLGGTSLNVLKLLAKGSLTAYSLIMALQDQAYKIATFKKPTLYTTLFRLRKKGYIKKFRKKFILTSKGKSLILNFPQIIKEYKPLVKSKDGKYRIVIFDIPEEHRKLRDSLRFILFNLGFKKLQKSVWISPFKCEKEIREFIKKFNLAPFVYLLIVDSIFPFIKK